MKSLEANMRISFAIGFVPYHGANFPRKASTKTATAGAVLLTLFAWLSVAGAQSAHSSQPFVFQREGRAVSIEPYGLNIVRITLSTSEPALAHPGYGFIATPSNSGWTHTQDSGYDVLRSSRLKIRIAPGNQHPPQHLPSTQSISSSVTSTSPPATTATIPLTTPSR